MGEIILISEGIPDLMPQLHRSPGVHVSDIIRQICLDLGHYSEQDSGDVDRSKMELGKALEHAIGHRYSIEYPDRYIQPGELELDGFFGTPDLLDVIDFAIHEIKLTWRSSNHDIDGPKFWKDWFQAKIYCKQIGSNIARLHLCHVDGDYDKKIKNRKVIYRVWEQRCDDRELAECWLMLKSYAKIMKGRN